MRGVVQLRPWADPAHCEIVWAYIHNRRKMTPNGPVGKLRLGLQSNLRGLPPRIKQKAAQNLVGVTSRPAYMDHFVGPTLTNAQLLTKGAVKLLMALDESECTPQVETARVPLT